MQILDPIAGKYVTIAVPPLPMPARHEAREAVKRAALEAKVARRAPLTVVRQRELDEGAL